MVPRFFLTLFLLRLSMSIDAKTPAEMPLVDFLNQLNRLQESAQTAFVATTTGEQLEAARVEFLVPRAASLNRFKSTWAAFPDPTNRRPVND